MQVNKNAEKKADPIGPEDCYARQAGVWIWLLGILIVVITLYVVFSYPGSGRRARKSGQGSGQPAVSSAVRPVAMPVCPYCPGYLDSQGRCNVPKCPIYSPRWGTQSVAMTTPTDGVQIKPLAMEVTELPDLGGVIVHAVYAGGFAEAGGLREGDLIRRFNGRRVRDLEKFQSFVALALPESNVKIQVLRNNEKQSCTVMVGEGEMEGAVVPVVNPMSGGAVGRFL